ncbi:hypothetical protein C8F01DRAFT_1286310 [Mycena amicta]|nr:hypothetical protein C8F01DRAFT_1286310 [Mycena amicta]
MRSLTLTLTLAVVSALLHLAHAIPVPVPGEQLLPVLGAGPVHPSKQLHQALPRARCPIDPATHRQAAAHIRDSDRRAHASVDSPDPELSSGAGLDLDYNRPKVASASPRQDQEQGRSNVPGELDAAGDVTRNLLDLAVDLGGLDLDLEL